VISDDLIIPSRAKSSHNLKLTVKNTISSYSAPYSTDDTTPSLQPPKNNILHAMAASQNPLGNPIPAFTEHAISVSLPKWADNVGYEEGEDRVADAMQTGYPRFFIHLNIRKVSTNRNDQRCPEFFLRSFISSTALLHPRTKIWHTIREIATVPISQNRRSMPHIPSRTRRLRPRRTTLYL
jgi:hypothetical protein